MGDLSKNFDWREFACPCCGLAAIDERLVHEVLQPVRDHFRRPIRINSGCRCKRHNDALRFCAHCCMSLVLHDRVDCPHCGRLTRQRSSITSRHLPDSEGTCHAADVVLVSDKTGPIQVANYIDTIEIMQLRGGLGRYRSFTHVDLRSNPARWYN